MKAFKSYLFHETNFLVSELNFKEKMRITLIGRITRIFREIRLIRFIRVKIFRLVLAIYLVSILSLNYLNQLMWIVNHMIRFSPQQSF